MTIDYKYYNRENLTEGARSELDFYYSMAMSDAESAKNFIIDSLNDETPKIVKKIHEEFAELYTRTLKRQIAQTFNNIMVSVLDETFDDGEIAIEARENYTIYGESEE